MGSQVCHGHARCSSYTQSGQGDTLAKASQNQVLTQSILAQVEALTRAFTDSKMLDTQEKATKAEAERKVAEQKNAQAGGFQQMDNQVQPLPAGNNQVNLCLLQLLPRLPFSESRGSFYQFQPAAAMTSGGPMLDQFSGMRPAQQQQGGSVCPVPKRACSVP